MYISFNSECFVLCVSSSIMILSDVCFKLDEGAHCQKTTRLKAHMSLIYLTYTCHLLICLTTDLHENE